MINKNSLLFFILYFFEGAPIGLIWWAIPTVMSSNGVDIATLTTMASLAALPWTFKFLLGPVVDRYFFSVRSYAWGVISFQILILLAFIFLMFSSITSPIFFWLILLISLLSASQDVLIDAWAIETVKEENRGSVNGAMQAGMLSGRWFFGAGLLLLLAHINWQIAIAVLCGLLVASIVFLIVKYSKDQSSTSASKNPLSLKSFKFIFTKKYLVLAAISLLTGFSFEGLGSTIGPFLIANSFSKIDIGYILTGNLIAMLVGSLVGGKLADKKGVTNIFLFSGVFLMLSVSSVGLLHMTGISPLLLSLVFVSYFLIGIFTTGSYSFFMKHSKGPMEATRFTFLMAMTNLCESAAAFSVGQITAGTKSTYTTGYIAVSAISFLGLSILWNVRKSENQSFNTN